MHEQSVHLGQHEPGAELTVIRSQRAAHQSEHEGLECRAHRLAGCAAAHRDAHHRDPLLADLRVLVPCGQRAADELGACPIRVSGHACHQLRQRCGNGEGCGQESLLAAREVVVDERRVDARAGREHAHRGALEALLGEELPCRDQQGLATVRPRKVGAALRGRLRVRRRGGAHDAWRASISIRSSMVAGTGVELGGDPGRVQCSAQLVRRGVGDPHRAAVEDDRRPRRR